MPHYFSIFYKDRETGLLRNSGAPRTHQASSRLRKRLILHQFTLIFKFMYLIKFTPRFFSLTTENFLSQSTFSQTFHNCIFPCFPLPCSKTSSLSLGQNCSLPPDTPPHALLSSLNMCHSTFILIRILNLYVTLVTYFSI